MRQPIATSLEAIQVLLKEVIASPHNFVLDVSLLDALSAQGKLASYADETRGIVSTSLNRMKRIANHSLPGRFQALDELRRSARNALARCKRSKGRQHPDSTRGLKKKLAEEQSTIEALKEELVFVTYGLNSAIELAERFAREARATEMWRKEKRTLLDKLSMRKFDVRPKNKRRLVEQYEVRDLRVASSEVDQEC